MFDFEVMLDNHLRFNMYPPRTDKAAFHIAKLAIEAGNSGEFDKILECIQSNAGDEVTAADVIEGWHLESFIEWELVDE